MYYQIIETGKENIGVVWDDSGKKTQIQKIYLPVTRNKLIRKMRKDFPFLEENPRKLRGGLDRVIAALYQGKPQKVSLSAFDMTRLKPFTKKVLIRACKIPRGSVATYSCLAKKTGSPKAARAVGTAMARNPFPIIIPCHRVIREDGTLGGFGGGLKMKKSMLQREGVKI